MANPTHDSQVELIKVPPHSLEAEQSVLGGLLLDNNAWDRVADMVAEGDFYRADHRQIYRHIVKLIEASRPADVVTVAESLDSTKDLVSVGGMAYLTALASGTPSAANIRRYAEIVRERAILRKLAAVATEIADSAYSTMGRDASQILDEAESKVFEIAEQGARGNAGFQDMPDLLTQVVQRIDMLYERGGTNEVTGVPTGYVDLDRMTSGLQPGDLVIVAGRPSMGKTSLAMNIAEHVALEAKLPVGVFSMEMASTQLVLRMLGSVGKLDQHKLRTGRLHDDDWKRLTDAVGRLNDARIQVDETPALNPLELRARARRLHREYKGLGLVVVDYLQLMSSSSHGENRATEISEISRSLKGLAKELGCPVIALSQLNRSLEQRPNKRPVMSDLRECVTGETLVLLADGRRVPIRDLVGTQPEVWAMREDRRVIAARSDRVWQVGVRHVFRVALASGRIVRATGRHRFYAGSGWARVDELRVGDRLAVARALPQGVDGLSWPEEKLILLGHLVGDGSYLVHQPLRYTTASEENSAAVAHAAFSLGSTVTRSAGRGAWHQLLIAGNGNRWHAAGVGKWLKDLGIFGQRSGEKRLPSEVFRLPTDQIATLLRHLWATDGCIAVRTKGQRGSARVYFSTCSRLLADDVAALLLRLGIVARIRSVLSEGRSALFTVDVSGADQQRRFLDKVGAFGPRVAPAERLRACLDGAMSNPTVDTLPIEVFAKVRECMQLRAVSQRAMAGMRGTSYGGSSHFRFAPSRQTVASYAELLDDAELRRWALDDLFWDRIVAIEPDGEEEVFDLTVPGPASWLADGIVSHNSGAIEQDADLILFIYRDEVYNPESPDKGIAEVIIGKQRNGPIGTVQLAFLGEYTRFENLADPRRY